MKRIAVGRRVNGVNPLEYLLDDEDNRMTFDDVIYG